MHKAKESQTNKGSSMSISITFFVDAVPVPKGRPRFKSLGKFVQTYTDTKTRDFEALIAEHARDAMGDMEPLETPLKVFLYFTLPIPTSASKKAKEALLDAPHTKKPDIDNLCKSVLDGMADIVFKNDGQIASLHATKRYGNHGSINVLVMENND